MKKILKDIFLKNKLVLENTARMFYTLTAGLLLALFGTHLLKLDLFGIIWCLIGAIGFFVGGILIDTIRKDIK